MSQPSTASVTCARQHARAGVKRLIELCLNDACRHTAPIEVWSYPAETQCSLPVETFGASRQRLAVSGVSAHRSRNNRCPNRSAISGRTPWPSPPPQPHSSRLCRTLNTPASFAALLSPPLSAPRSNGTIFSSTASRRLVFAKLYFPVIRPAGWDLAGLRDLRGRLCLAPDRRGDLRTLWRPHRPQGDPDRDAAC